jgi:copper(I)-binding protein
VRWTLASLVALVACVHAATARAEITLENAWMRPAYAGQAQASVYVDIRSTEALKLVGASSPAAKRAELVLVDPPGNDPTKHKVVASLPVAANAPTRLAYLGNHVRLIELTRNVVPGELVGLNPFVDAKACARAVTGACAGSWQGSPRKVRVKK